MPIDSRNKRASVIGVQSSAPRLEQNPAGSIAQVGRQFAALCYVGILATLPVTAPASTFLTWNHTDGVLSWNAEPTTLQTWGDN
jgi:hypothetical protein